MCRWPNGVGGIYTSCAPNEDPDNHKYFSVFAREPACGDGVRSTDEICDVSDGGETDWRHDYEDKPGRGYVCNSSCQSICPAIRVCEDEQEMNCCGNGILEPGEECELTGDRESLGVSGASQCNPETCTEIELKDGERVRLKDSGCDDLDNDCADEGQDAEGPNGRQMLTVYHFSRNIALPQPDDTNAPTPPYVGDVADRHVVRLGGSAKMFRPHH